MFFQQQINDTQDEVKSFHKNSIPKEFYGIMSDGNKAVAKVSGKDGSSVADAVIIKSEYSMLGINTEYKYLEVIHTNGFERIMQSLHIFDDKPYDVLVIEEFKTGKTLKYYFDISGFFGKKSDFRVVQNLKNSKV
jgi:hypothetical protein